MLTQYRKTLTLPLLTAALLAVIAAALMFSPTSVHADGQECVGTLTLVPDDDGNTPGDNTIRVSWTNSPSRISEKLQTGKANSIGWRPASRDLNEHNWKHGDKIMQTPSGDWVFRDDSQYVGSPYLITGVNPIEYEIRMWYRTPAIRGQTGIGKKIADAIKADPPCYPDENTASWPSATPDGNNLWQDWGVFFDPASRIYAEIQGVNQVAREQDHAGIWQSKPDPLEITEGASRSYGLHFTTMPKSEVTITPYVVDSDDAHTVTFEPASITVTPDRYDMHGNFVRGNWLGEYRAPHCVRGPDGEVCRGGRFLGHVFTVTAVDDGMVEDRQVLIHHETTTEDMNYASVIEELRSIYSAAFTPRFRQDELGEIVPGTELGCHKTSLCGAALYPSAFDYRGTRHYFHHVHKTIDDGGIALRISEKGSLPLRQMSVRTAGVNVPLGRCFIGSKVGFIGEYVECPYNVGVNWQHGVPTKLELLHTGGWLSRERNHRIPVHITNTTMSAPPGGGGNERPGPPSSLSLELAQAKVKEDVGDVTVTATLDQPAPPGGASVALYPATGSTATRNADYALPSSVDIAEGERSGSATITITDDALDESDETVVIAALASILDADLVSSVELVIVDNDESYSALIARIKQWRNDPRYVHDQAHTDRWDRALLSFGETVADTSLSPMTADEAQTYADRGWTRWVEVSTALRKIEAAGQQSQPATPNQAPTVSGAIADATIVTESGTHAVALSGVFADADSDPLTVTVASSDQDVATAVVASDHTGLTVTARARGQATITVTANDGRGGTVSDAFTVTVKAAPAVSSALSDLRLYTDVVQEISLSGVFSDADGDALTFTAESSDDELVSAFVFHGTLTIVAVAEGSATITAMAEDIDGNSVSDSFVISVSEAPPVVANLRCIAETERVAFLWDAPEWSDGETYAYDYQLTLPDGRSEGGRLIDITLRYRPGEYQVGAEASISVTTVYKISDGSHVSSAEETLTCLIK